MASDQVLFNEDRMRKLMKDVQDIEDHANYLRNAANGFVNQLDGQWLSQIGADTAQVQALINKLTSKAEGMNGFLDFTIKKVKETEQANIKDAQALKQATSTGKSWWERLASSLGAEAKAVVQKIVSGLEHLAKTLTHTNPLKLLIAPIPTLLVEVAKEFQVQIQTASIEKQLGSLKQDKTVAQLLDQRAKGTPAEQKWANERLEQIKEAYTALGRSQAAYHMYAKFGNQAYMVEATKEMEAERIKLGQLGIASSFYDENVDVSSFYAGSALLACKYNPAKNDHSEMPQDNELRSLILTSLSKGNEGEWAIKRLEQLEQGPQLLAYDPNQMITLEELATGKSSRYSEEQLLALRRSLSPEDQAELAKIHAKNWFHEGAVRAFLFDNLIEPYANTMDSFFNHNTAGQFINRASQVTAGETFRGKLDSTGNQTADQIAGGLGKVMELFTPVAGMEVGQISFTGLGTLAKQAASKFPLIDKGVERVHGGIGSVVEKKEKDAIKPRGTEGTGKGNTLSSTVNIDNGELIEHLVDGHGIGRGSKPSVKGAHNLDSFNKTIDEEASKYGLTRSDFIIGDPKPHPQIEGIYEVNYRIPSLETDYVNRGLKLKLNSDGTVVYKTVINPKTVYGPPITTDDIIKWGKEAIEGVEKAGKPIIEGRNIGVAENGLKFEWLIVDGKINSIYPVLD
ncbi:hypothetical protein GCM10008018_72100 [Paenibacillus marchantiophytorum]|uniref:Bacterial EndoU nuclease domain-containing protein n=1 Tax=Paenibacillus marchantiophytorum TaxID=1619310 RepID=A0ABQ1FK75_9BACL|nr:CdiA family toxin C-terminal domain-containing protein [Paenibacillus marchantiophytorum]GGA17438.1 hypothetical protein GCM10008018_72100 [Paenibacillus marchantiophytorum]